MHVLQGQVKLIRPVKNILVLAPDELSVSVGSVFALLHDKRSTSV